MVKYMGQILPESIVEVVAKVIERSKSNGNESISGLELEIQEIYCLSRAEKLPMCVEDRHSISEIMKYRYLSLRHSSCHEIFKVQSLIGRKFCEFMYSKDFTEIHTPKIIQQRYYDQYSLDYFGNTAHLAQHSKFHQQMAIQGGLERVFEISPSYIKHNGSTHKDLNESTILEFGMVINSHYHEVISMTLDLLNYIFDGICEYKGLDVIQQSFECKNMTRGEIMIIPLEEAIELVEANFGSSFYSSTDLGFTERRQLAELFEHHTDILIVTHGKYCNNQFEMPNVLGGYNNFSIIFKGIEIGSGSQYIHDSEILKSNNQMIGNVECSMKELDYGSFPCGGCSIHLEAFLMSFLGLSNVRHTSMFPRDAKSMYFM